DDAFRGQAGSWRKCQGGLPARHPALAVIALYPAQAELIRMLLRRNQTAAHPLGIEVGVPTAFRQRECHTALVSLTRSHTHRAVAYGESPEQLLLALTRP